MNRGLQISLLIVTFVISTGVGYYVSDMFFGETTEPSTPAVETPAVVEEPELSPIPEIINVTTPEWVEGVKKYKFKVVAKVENGNALKYYLYTDKDFEFEYGSSYDGEFYVDGSDSGTYYLMVANNVTCDPDHVKRRVITDCDKRAPRPVQSNVRPLTENEVEHYINVNPKEHEYFRSDWKAYFAPNHRIKVFNNSTLTYDRIEDLWLAKRIGEDFKELDVVLFHWTSDMKISQVDINVY